MESKHLSNVTFNYIQMNNRSHGLILAKSYLMIFLIIIIINCELSEVNFGSRSNFWKIENKISKDVDDYKEK